MISLRQHAISIAAIFFALAIGIVLGSQTIASDLLSGLRDDKSDLQSQVDTLGTQNQQLRNQVDAGETFAGANAGRILANTLTDRTVVVVTTPDADPGDLDAVVRMVQTAGGTVTGKLALTESFLDTTSADRLRTTVTNVVPAGVQLRTGSVDQGSLSGDLLGSVVLLNAQSAQPQTSPQDAALALDALRSGGFVTYDDNSVAPGQLAVILTGDESGADGGNRGSVVARFAAALDARGAGTVLAGRPGSALGSGPIAVTRADAALASAASTVDNVNMQTGRITVPLALAEQLDGISGRYGTGPNASAPTVGAAPS